MLAINHLLVISFANIFFHSVGWLLISLIGFHLFIFAFVSFALGDKSKKILLQFISKSVLPMFSSKSFIVSGLAFTSLILFEFIFVYGVRECSNFILLHVAVQFHSTTY